MLGRGECSACMRVRGACICDRPTRVTAKGLKPVKPRSAGRAAPKADRSPHPCAQQCTAIMRRYGGTCGVTMHGGVCPCPDC